MNISFTDFFKRLRQATGIITQIELAEALGVNRSAVTQAKVRNAVPQKWILALARRYSLSPDWLEFGRGLPRPINFAPRAAEQTAFQNPKGLSSHTSDCDCEELVYVPKVAARLCAGAGSFEVEELPVAKYPLPLRWISRLGSPSNMIFMDVSGDSMEPGIMDGDTVLIDRSNAGYATGAVMAVAFEDAIYLKRLEKKNYGMIMHSDNSTHLPIKIQGEELDLFRILGKVVWLCRRCT